MKKDLIRLHVVEKMESLYWRGKALVASSSGQNAFTTLTQAMTCIHPPIFGLRRAPKGRFAVVCKSEKFRWGKSCQDIRVLRRDIRLLHRDKQLLRRYLRMLQVFARLTGPILNSKMRANHRAPIDLVKL